MADDFSIYESGHPNRKASQQGFCFGRITRIYPDEGMCEVKTFGGNSSIHDNSISRCQWINLNFNQKGDIQGGIPKLDSIGIVFFIGGEAFIFGYPSIQNESGKVPFDENIDPPLRAGDQIMKTSTGNRIIVRNSGSIEIYSKETCKTIYIPLDSRILTLCRNMDFKADGGFINWENKNELNETLYTAEFRKDVARSTIVVEEKGAIDATTVYRVAIGPGVPGTTGIKLAFYSHTVDITGKSVLSITPGGSGVGGINFSLNPTGEAKLTSNETTELTFSPAGEINLKNKLTKISVSVAGEYTVDGPGGTIKISPFGEVSIDAKQKITMKAKAGMDVNVIGDLKMEAVGQVKIKGITAEIDGGPGATDNVLCWPTTISPFTGTPLVPFSTTVKVSK